LRPLVFFFEDFLTVFFALTLHLQEPPMTLLTRQHIDEIMLLLVVNRVYKAIHAVQRPGIDL
jgi:hypothetical protein